MSTSFGEALAKLAIPVDKPRRMTILHPATKEPMKDADGNVAFIELLCFDSEIGRRHGRELARRFSGKNSRHTQEDDAEEAAAEMLAVLTRSWLLVGLDGVRIELPYALESAKSLYSAGAMIWLRRQVDAFVGDIGNFARQVEE